VEQADHEVLARDLRMDDPQEVVRRTLDHEVLGWLLRRAGVASAPLIH